MTNDLHDKEDQYDSYDDSDHIFHDFVRGELFFVHLGNGHIIINTFAARVGFGGISIRVVCDGC